SIIAWIESNANPKVFLVIDGPKAAENATNAQVLAGYTGMISGATPLTASSYAALYGPWLVCNDPSTSVYGSVRMLPPGGAILGQYAKTDTIRNVAKAPAGTETRLVGVLAMETRFTETQLDTAAQNHINIIR